MRSIGKIFIKPTAINLSSFGWHGLIVVKQENLAAAEVPDVDSENAEWIFQAYWNVQASNTSDPSQWFKADFDLKAKRRLRVNDNIAYVIKVDSGANVGITWSSAWRNLFLK